ncbi:MAG: DIP1984 family protein [Ruminococcus flavefaciens]|nr:DIP1984 family protein [Ruminococcus flavefaciens]MCM1062741.1 DIP1984 family protein [Eubacterium sp.]
MKLATALSERSDIQNKISEISVRLNNNAKVQDGDTPTENPIKLIEELDSMLIRLEYLMAKINLTNSRTVYDGKTITELLARRDCLKKKIETIRNFLNNSSNRVNRMTRTEIKIISTVPVSEIQETLDCLSKELRQTDEKIQELNWTTELI